MAGMRDIKRRIRSIKNTQQITKAMKMVSAAKLRRAQDKVIQARPYAKLLQESLSRIVAAAKEASHPLMEERDVKRVGYVVVTADRGLAGGFNANIIRKVYSEVKGRNNVGLVTIGRKGRDFFKRVGVQIDAEYTGLPETIQYCQAQDIARTVIGLYTEGKVDRVVLVFSQFFSALTQTPTTIQLLPVPKQEASEKGEGAVSAQYTFEPDAEEVLAKLLPRYVETQIYRALLESKAGFYGAQMTAMDSATKNAKEMIDKLTLSLNRARQAAITKEIAEIVGGAAALG